MKEKRTIVKNPDNLSKGKSNWAKLESMSEDEIEAAAQDDKEALPLSKAELAKFKRVTPIKKVDVKKIRLQVLHLSQSEFAAYFGISLRTLQQWEQGRSAPRGAARNFLRVIEREPRAVQRALCRR